MNATWLTQDIHFSNKASQTYEPVKHYWLYALRLEQNKFYIGITAQKDPNVRLAQHGSYYGAKWTQLYKPDKLLKLKSLGNITKSEAEVIEHELTMKYMKKYGLQNVRGAKFCYTGRYVQVGNRYWRDNDFTDLVLISIMTFTIFVLGLGYLAR